MSIWLAHRVALRLATLMVIYTAVSLSVIAEPMVKFEAPEAVSGR